jgi:hypothetical protein
MMFPFAMGRGRPTRFGSCHSSERTNRVIAAPVCDIPHSALSALLAHFHVFVLRKQSLELISTASSHLAFSPLLAVEIPRSNAKFRFGLNRWIQEDVLTLMNET